MGTMQTAALPTQVRGWKEEKNKLQHSTIGFRSWFEWKLYSTRTIQWNPKIPNPISSRSERANYIPPPFPKVVWLWNHSTGLDDASPPKHVQGVHMNIMNSGIKHLGNSPKTKNSHRVQPPTAPPASRQLELLVVQLFSVKTLAMRNGPEGFGLLFWSSSFVMVCTCSMCWLTFCIFPGFNTTCLL